MENYDSQYNLALVKLGGHTHSDAVDMRIVRKRIIFIQSFFANGKSMANRVGENLVINDTSSKSFINGIHSRDDQSNDGGV